MNLATWAERHGVAQVSAYRWFDAGTLAVPARKVGRLILVDQPAREAGPQARTAVNAQASSADQKADVDRQLARVTAWAAAEQVPVDKVVVEVGSALNGHRRTFLTPCRSGWEFVQAALAAQGQSWWSWRPPMSMTTRCGT